jgi:hypothetical protein
LGDGWGNLEAEVQDLLLALKADILWPPSGYINVSGYFKKPPDLKGKNVLHHARQVTLGLDILTNTVVSGSLLEEGILSTQVSTQIYDTMIIQKRGGCMNIPSRPSCCYRPSLAGTARVRASFLWVAIIEKKRDHQHICSQMFQ